MSTNEFTISVVAVAPRSLLKALGDAMARHRRVIQGIQWIVVVFYALLVALPAFLPLPDQYSHIYNDLTLFAQFVFWGIWWPFVMISMMLMGRVWCGVFCPEGALTELASRHGLGKAIPRWLRWGGWPFVAFVLTTIFGQLVSVYEYPKAALLVLGGSTVAAVGIGLLYGRGVRVWCRYLCPANGVFALLSRLSPLHFRVDRAAWNRQPKRIAPVNCAPLINIRNMTSASACHACGRCSGHRDAVALAMRSPNKEILALRDTEVSRGEVLTLIFGVLGVAIGAFQWSSSPWFVAVKQRIAEWLVERDSFLLLQDNAPWWLLTHYPEANDVFTWLDGLCILGYISATALVLGGWIMVCLYAAQRLLSQPGLLWRLAYCLIPLGGLSVFLGLSGLTVAMLKAERLDLRWVADARVALLALAVLWTGWLATRMIFSLQQASLPRRAAAFVAIMAGVAAVIGLWVEMFFIW